MQGEIWSELMLYPVLNTVLHGTVAVLSRRSRRERHARRDVAGTGPLIAVASASNPASRMDRAAAEAEGRDDALRLSHRLVALHAGGIALLIVVVLGTALWLSAQHNRLAIESSQRLVENELESIRNGTYTLVRDYSIWDEGFAAVVNDDREWLYSSIGSSVTELDTFDLAILVPERPAPTSAGWPARRRRARSDILPPPLLAAIVGLLDISDRRGAAHADADRRVRRRALVLRGLADDARRGHAAGDAARRRCRCRSTGRG